MFLTLPQGPIYSLMKDTIPSLHLRVLFVCGLYALCSDLISPMQLKKKKYPNTFLWTSHS